jgi:predicted permease
MWEAARILLRRFASLFRSRALDEDLDQELHSHIELAIEAAERSGIGSEEARREAMRAFGGIAQTREIYREQRGLPMLETILQDLRYGWRMLARTPGFTAVAALSLALGIGANTAIFSLIDAVLLKLLPVKDPHALVLLAWAVPAGKDPGVAHWTNGRTWDERGRGLGAPFSYPTYRQLRANNQAFSELFAFADAGNLSVVVDGEARRAFTQMVSGNYFSALGIRPSVGRILVESDDQAGAPPVCMISDSYWKRRFGGSPSVAGTHVVIGGVPFTIAGVMPPEFFGLQPGLAIDVSVPISMQPLIVPRWDPKMTSILAAADHWWVQMMGRLKPGVSARQAAASLTPQFQQALAAVAASSPQPGTVVPWLELQPASQGLSQLRNQFSRPLSILMGMVGLVLLIACANVANLLLARATARQKEIGVRLSLGAPRSRLIRQLLTESLLLACIGGTLGTAFAWWGSRILLALLSHPGNPLTLNVSPDLRVLAFTAAACLVTGLLFGLAPAFRATRVDVAPALKHGVPSLRGSISLAKALMVAQAALSLVLLFGAGLFVRTLVNLESLDTGFDQQRVLLFGIDASQAGYLGPALNDFYDRVQQRVAALPGVVSATASLHLLLSGSSRGNSFWVPGYTPKPDERMGVHVMPAGANFFATMKIPLLSGRDFTTRDDENAPKIAVINEAFAKLYFQNQNPIGRHIQWDRKKADTDMEIVGVAKDARYNSLRADASPTIYHPFRQAGRIFFMHFEVRAAGNPQALIPSVRRAVASIDRNVPLFDVKTQAEQIDELLMQERLFAKLSSFFGLLALLLACVGIYGILSYAVARRSSELGVRMALGAQRRDIVHMVLREALLVAAAGLALGIPASLLAARLASGVISDLLYGLKAADATSILLAAAALIVVAVFAGIWPARRASRVDPLVALRYE